MPFSNVRVLVMGWHGMRSRYNKTDYFGVQLTLEYQNAFLNSTIGIVMELINSPRLIAWAPSSELWREEHFAIKAN